MKIRKKYQGVLPDNKIVNTESNSQTDTYSCDYINNMTFPGGGDELPAGSVIEYNGTEIPEGWSEVQEDVKSAMIIASNSGDTPYTFDNWIWQTITLNNLRFKQGNGFTHDGTKIVCNKDMLVRVDACTMFNKTPICEINLCIMKNGTEQISYVIENTTKEQVNQTACTPSTIVNVSAGDTLELRFGGVAGSYVVVEQLSTCHMTVQEL